MLAVSLAPLCSSFRATRRGLACCVLLLAAGYGAQAQTATPVWTSAELIGDTASANGTSGGTRVRPDPQGGVWAMGNFQGKITCGATTLRSNAGSSDLYLGRLDAAGQWRWARRVGGPLLDRGGDLATDAAGNAYLTGSFQDSITLGSFHLTAQGAARTNAYVAKLSPAGQWLWVAQAGGDAAGTALAVDPTTGATVVAGSFGGVVTFGTTTMAAVTNQAVDRDICLARLDAAGQWLSASRAGGRRQDVPTALALDGQGGVVVVGTIASRTATFGPTTITNVSLGVNQAGGNLFADTFVALYDLPTQRWRWATAGGGGYDETADAVAIGPGGRITVAGTYNGRRYDTASVAQFGSFVLGTAADWARPAYVAQLAATGQWIRATAGADSSIVDVGGLVLDAAGEPTISGSFTTHRARFGTVRLTNTGYAPAPQYSTYTPADLFVAHLGATGQWAWGLAAGGPGTEVPANLCADPISGALTLTGRFTGLPTFGGNPPLLTLGASTGAAYVARLTVAGGARQWAWAVAPGSGGAIVVADLAFDAQGNALVMGRFTGRQRLGTHVLTPPSQSAALGGNALFVAKRSPTGQWLWVSAVGLRAGFGWSPRLLVDPATGDAYISGAITEPATFGAIPVGAVPPATALYGGARPAFFLARISAAGQWLWVTTPAYSNLSQVTSIALDPRGGLVVVGLFSDTLTLGGTSLLSYGAAPGFSNTYDGFVGRLSAYGQWLSVKQVTGTSYDYLNAVAVDATGAATIAGVFLGDLTLDSTFAFVDSSGGFRVRSFIGRLSPANVWQWALEVRPGRYGGLGFNDLALDRAGNVLAVGSFGDTVRLGTTLLTTSHNNNGGGDGFVAKLDAGTRQWLWARQYGGFSFYNDATRLVLDAADNAYVGGTFSGGVRLGATSLLAGIDNPTGLVAKISPTGAWRWALPTRSSQGSTVVGFGLRPGGELLVAGNFYGAPLTLGATTLASGALPTGFLASIGAPLGLAEEAERAGAEGLQVYPNPARATATVRLPAPASGGSAPLTGQLVDALGRVVSQFGFRSGEQEILLDLKGCTSGLYVVRVFGVPGMPALTRRLVIE